MVLVMGLGIALDRLIKRRTAVAVGAVFLLAGAAVAFLSIFPGYMEHRFRDALSSSATGPGWNERTVGHFRVHYQESDPGVSEVVKALPVAYETVTPFFGDLPEQMPVFIYPDVATMESAVGYDFPDFGSASHIAGAIIVHSPATWSAEFRSQTAVEPIVTHELAHLAAVRIAGKRLPKWLNEGLAPYVAGQYTPASARAVAEQARTGRLYSFAELNEAFRSPTDSGGKNRGFAYIQGASIVDYMVKRYGPDHFQQVLTGLGAGKGLDQAFRAALGVSVDELEAAWRKSL